MQWKIEWQEPEAPRAVRSLPQISQQGQDSIESVEQFVALTETTPSQDEPAQSRSPTASKTVRKIDFIFQNSQLNGCSFYVVRCRGPWQPRRRHSTAFIWNPD